MLIGIELRKSRTLKFGQDQFKVVADVPHFVSKIFAAADGFPLVDVEAIGPQFGLEQGVEMLFLGGWLRASRRGRGARLSRAVLHLGLRNELGHAGSGLRDKSSRGLHDVSLSTG